MLRKVFRAGNSVVISLPREAVEYLGLAEGSEVFVELDRDARQLVLKPMTVEVGDVDAEFARQVNTFIERYRPALEALAK
jgi:putative addiction module antidote